MSALLQERKLQFGQNTSNDKKVLPFKFSEYQRSIVVSVISDTVKRYTTYVVKILAQRI